jgi:hypothetical protein
MLQTMEHRHVTMKLTRKIDASSWSGSSGAGDWGNSVVWYSDVAVAEEELKRGARGPCAALAANRNNGELIGWFAQDTGKETAFS